MHDIDEHDIIKPKHSQIAHAAELEISVEEPFEESKSIRIYESTDENDDCPANYIPVKDKQKVNHE